MSKLLWQSDDAQDVDELLMEFLAGEDVILDQSLFLFDIQATRAHVAGLASIGILTDDDALQLNEWLEALSDEFVSGRFVLDAQFEDGHSAIEHYLRQQSEELGGRVHTGRSRNDQVLAASRLYLKDSLARLIDLVRDIAHACLERAESDPQLPMPGYTHLQRAVPSSVGMWLGGFAEGFADTLDFARSVLDVIDCNPLGTAAGYGVNLKLDRDGVTNALEFGRLQINPVNAQNSRGKFEVMALQAASHALHDVQRLAWDLSLFTTAEFGFIELPERFTTGSSIMPNKRNPDVVELLRARPAVVDAAIQEIQNITALPSGYHRDLQFTKAPMIRGFAATLQALAIVPGLVREMVFREQAMRDAISSEMYATDAAVDFAAQGEPFRSAYRRVKQTLESSGERSPEESLKRRISPGASGNLRLEKIRARLLL